MNAPERLTPRLLDALHTEALLLSDEARSYFDGAGRSARDALDPIARVDFACEALKLSARLAEVMTWLMSHRAAAAERDRLPGDPVIGGSLARADHGPSPRLPAEACQLIAAVSELHARIERLDRSLAIRAPAASPARTLIAQLERAF